MVSYFCDTKFILSRRVCVFTLVKTHSPLCVPYGFPKNCVAAMELCVFGCVASATHFFILQKEGTQMKKAISLLLALAMCLSLCACGGGQASGTKSSELKIGDTAKGQLFDVTIQSVEPV